jgi:diaminopimelate epimerase
MKRIDFTKMVASGNDFVLVDRLALSDYRLPLLAQRICDRRYGVGADGLLILEKSRVANIRMRVFNPDGSEAQMCGNGARCVSLWLSAKRKRQQNTKLNLEAKAGIIDSEVKGSNVKIRLSEPKNIKLDIPIKINNRALRVNFIDTGVPHTIIFAQGLDKIDVVKLGRRIRYHRYFYPEGTNVDFVELLTDRAIKIRTYERGVEEETLACGTGAVACALLSTIHYLLSTYKVIVYTKSGELLKVYFRKSDNKFKDVWLEGKARIIYRGQYYV